METASSGWQALESRAGIAAVGDQRKPTGWTPLTAEQLVGKVAQSGLLSTPDELRAFLLELGYNPMLYVRARIAVRSAALGMPLPVDYVWDRPDLPVRRRP